MEIDNEKNVPTQQQKTRKQTRVPRAHEQQKWTKCFAKKKSKGP
jgi:hypothetical protein